MHAAILTLLARESTHGCELVNRLARLRMFHGRKPDPTGVYRLIRHMGQEGLVRSRLTPSPSGCGKTTLLRLAAGLDRPTRGSVYVGGDLVDGPRQGIGFVSQDPALSFESARGA